MNGLIDLVAIPDPARGMLVAMEANRQVPFEVQRVFILCDVPNGAMRGNHAHHQQHQLLIVTAGAFDTVIESREGRQEYRLDGPKHGLHVPPMAWVTMHAAAAGSTCVVLASQHFDEADYIRDRTEFERLLRR
jgi:dTDP-4-dehydrorhamnose 3,5-epimerase-like enzyme